MNYEFGFVGPQKRLGINEFTKYKKRRHWTDTNLYEQGPNCEDKSITTLSVSLKAGDFGSRS